MESVIRIGNCIGCSRTRRLEDKVCADCLNSPHRGRKWANIAHRIRGDPQFAQIVYGQMRTLKARRLFLLMFSESMEASGVDLSFMRALAEVNITTK